MFIKFVDTDWLFFWVILTTVCCLRACHMWLTTNYMFIREIWGKFTSFIFLKFWNLPCFTREIPKLQKSELSKFIPNFPLKHVINCISFNECKNGFVRSNSALISMGIWSLEKFPLLVRTGFDDFQNSLFVITPFF